MRPLRLFYSFVLAALCSGVTVADAARLEQFVAQVVAIADGDTLSVSHDGTTRKLRLCGIDSPEKAQTFGQQAKNFTSDMALGQQVHVTVVGKDRFGRSISEVSLADGRNLNDLILEQGMGWWYEKYCPADQRRRSMESGARERRVGLWRDKAPVAPWTYRLLCKQQSKSKKDFR